MHFACHKHRTALWGIGIALIAQHPATIEYCCCLVLIGFFAGNAKPDLGIEIGQFVHDGVTYLFVGKRFHRVFV